MTTTMRSALFLIPATMLLACGGDALTEADAKQLEGQRRIRAMEDSLFANQAMDQRSSQALIDVYKAYAVAYPQDSLAPEYLFRAGGVHESLHRTDEALELYDRVLKDYPRWEERVVLLFKKAVMLHNAGRLGEARTAYMVVISTYPDHKFAKDARVLVETMDVGDDEWIDKAQEMESDPDAGSGV